MAKHRSWTTVQFLARLLQLFDRPSHWTKGNFIKYKKVHGRKVACYCIMGGLNHVGGSHNPNSRSGVLTHRMVAYNRARDLIATACNRDIVSFNDAQSTTFRQMRSVLKHALRMAKEEAAA